ncbi:nuclear transport factor 2 family protein [Streptomyces virginiae]|uniref:nuclear transport factor 2 family protein n=1 Tax=Streptomyces virginiae TaxID=1961 RepID=UPI002253C1B0|nr:nuclear transport factor 2 family protein [Streptomyces virginiae]MCX4957482.1 nuclear transport factor 2 family protein [Streptomyces virginiae]MCX5176224.1 nuclear transport factor 2 family protein [Streptomyces virginiae]
MTPPASPTAPSFTGITAAPAPVPSQAQVYAEIQQFYAQQMYLLDEGATDKWALTFTPDAWLDLPMAPVALQGQDSVAGAARLRRDELDREDRRQRHVPCAVFVDPVDAGTVRARCQVLVLTTLRGGRPDIAFSMTCEDVLVRAADGAGWLVKDRLVVSDSSG